MAPISKARNDKLFIVFKVETKILMVLFKMVVFGGFEMTGIVVLNDFISTTKIWSKSVQSMYKMIYDLHKLHRHWTTLSLKRSLVLTLSVR